MNILRRPVVLLLLSLQVLAATAQAACSRPVKVVISPMGRNMMVEADGGIGGVVPDFLKLVASRTGCQFEFITVPRARALVLFENGAVDLIPGTTRTDERDKLGLFVHMYNSRAMLIALAGKLPPELGLDEVSRRGLRLGAVRGNNYGPEYLRLVAEAGSLPRLSLVPDPDTAARMLGGGRFDAVLAGPSVFAEAAQRAGLADTLAITQVNGMQPTQVGIYLNRQAVPAADQARLADAIGALVGRGEYSRLVRQYYAEPKWSTQGLSFVVGRQR
ncbi:transporter substrate-binding domain-containing protein [Pseudoduganella sp. DS3]|uniref:Transporter substrate-binding domain-containing protein n=1 Tax=Pseudoduganella guangdongensis TaxID=2692179 RepID=A0A6N9HHM5_9BURK|nr:transporter substrate-binding domain-containing protein [Pseudoduganella guangdongensis]MYN02583.1 transporter substrate-binding domain-containing protein [Pseudoduganella guangdongensis]